ncbi:MAG: Ig-like domain repeat protein, partial [Methanobrevibacter sp.]|nr:Ig-like domain repeat protein [Methanobrevibacter sp.]
MKVNKFILIIFIITVIFSLSTVNASDMNITQSNNLSVDNDNYENVLTGSPMNIYVDSVVGYDNINDGSSKESSLKTIEKAISIANDNDNIYLADGVYTGLKNTRLNIDKSLNFIGSQNTVIDGENKNYIFNISDGVKVTFKNIKFINAFKDTSSYSHTYAGLVYGGVLSINDATVVVDNCSFIDNSLDNNYGDLYGGAISNFGDLTIKNSYFEGNKPISSSGFPSHGGAIYNNGKLSISNTTITNSVSTDGPGIYNNGSAIMKDSVISDSRSRNTGRGSAIFNSGNFTILDSIVENNYVDQSSNTVRGAVYNDGKLVVRGTIFRENSAKYANNRRYTGSSVIYNNGDLNLTYSAFIGNLKSNGISGDVYNSGDIISLDNNWWGSNDNPTKDVSRVGISDYITTWLILNLTPEYLKLNISEIGEISAFWTNNLNQIPQIDLFPLFNVTFTVDYEEIVTEELKNGKATFIFDETDYKSQYIVEAIIGDFTQEMIVDVGKMLTNLDVESNNDILFNETLIVNVSLTNANGRPISQEVSVEYGGKVYYCDLINGKDTLEINNLKPGNYTLKVIYDGDDDYFKSTYTKSITIRKRTANLSVIAPEVKIGQYGEAIVTLLPDDDKIKARSILYIDGKRQGTYKNLFNGNTTIRLPLLEDGEHNLTIEYMGTDVYYSAVASTIFKVSLYESAMNVSAKNIKVGEDAIISITVDPEDLEGEATLTINGYEQTIYLDGITTNVTISDLAAGTYNVSVYYDGYAKYYPLNASTSFKVEKALSKLDVNLTQDDKNLKATLIIKTIPSDCTGVVSVWVNYRQYNATLKNGQATVDVKLDKGSNLIFVNYEGDDYYDDSNWNTTIGVVDNVILIGRNSTGWSYNDFDYAIRLTEENGVPIPGVNVTVEFDGEKHNITTNANGLAYYTLKLPTGKYTISATYQLETIFNTLTVKDIEFNLTTQDIVYGDVESIETSFDSAIKGKVNLIITGILNETVDIVDNKANYNLSGLNAGKYTLKAIYLNDYTSKSKSSKFNVDKATLNFDVDIKDVVANDDEIITVSNLSDATGKIVFTVNGKTYQKTIKNGEAILKLSKLNLGNYSLDINYKGDKNHYNASYSTVFYVKGLKTPVTVTINDAKYGANLVAKATLNKNATGTVRFTTEDFTEDVKIKNGVATWKFTGVNVGQHEIVADYLGDNYYVSSTNSTTYSVSKAESSIVLYVKDVCLNENIRIYTNLSTNATGQVLYSMNGYYSPRYKPVVDSACHWYISPLGTGNYTVIAVYPGDDNYYGSNTTFILEVKQKRSILNVEIDDAGLNDRVVANINLKSVDDVELTDYITLKVNNRAYDVFVDDGEATLVLGKLPAGTYTFEATYDGNENYSKASSNGKFEVRDTLLDAILVANDFSKYYKGNQKFAVSLTSSKGQAIDGVTITVKVGGKTYSGVTDGSGKAYFDLDLNSGNYTAEIKSEETRTYHANTTEASVTINPTVEGIDVAKLEGSGDLYYAIFSDSNGKVLANKKVQLKIGTKSLTATTLPNGIIRVNIDLEVGNYTIVATNPVTGESATNNLFVYKYLMENKDITKNYLGSENYSVRAYGDDGKPVGAGQIVKITINGKTYSVATDKNGYASLPINLYPGDYTVKASYKGYTVTNKIKVKKSAVYLRENKDITKNYLGSEKYSVRAYGDNDKPVGAGQIVKITINGKTYDVSTDKNGYASLAINLYPGDY